MSAHPSPDRLRRAQDLFHRALTLDPQERAGFLVEACPDDEDLRSEVEELLARDGRPSVVRGRVAEAVEGVLGAPERIGPYRVVEQLGHGGMGIVYRARQENPDRDVALKLLRPTLFSESHHARFRNEAQVLARLQHPGIAQVYEAGTIDIGFGEQPWFAMELVAGETLSRWAEERTTREKLELVVRICRALEHAHGRGIVHRDLKPDNVLVREDGNPKVLDFGVARVMDSERLTSLRTGVQSLVGTLPYMSPEQAQGETERVDPRSDVYSLGVVTYELLAGVLPFDLREKPLASAARVIVEDEPRPLSSCHKAFRGDMDTILRKTLEKEPARRYASAEELAADLERYLRDEPVQARPPSTWYQLSKLAKRNRRLFVAIAAAFLLLVAGTVTSSVLAVRAQAEATRSAKVVQLALGMLSPGEMTKSNPSPVALLDHAAARVEEQLGDQPDLAGDFYLMIGQLFMTLDRVDKAEVVFGRAVAEHRKVEDEFPEKLERSVFAYRGVATTSRDARSGIESWGELADLRAKVFGDAAPATVEARFMHAVSVGKAGDLDRSCELLRDLAVRYAGAMSLMRHKDVGATLYRNGYFEAAEETLRPLLERFPSPTDSQDDNLALFWVAFQLSGLYSDIGDLERAEWASRQMSSLADKSANPGATSWTKSGETYAKYMHAHVLHRLGRAVEAESYAREAVRIVETVRRVDIAFPWRELGQALLVQGRLVEAEEALCEYLERQSRQTGDGPWYVAQAESMLGNLLRERGRLDEALELGNAGLEHARDSLRTHHPRIADALEPLARTLVELDRLDEAEALCREAIDIRERCMDADAPPVESVRLVLTEIAALRGEADALALAEAAHRSLVERLPADHPELGRALHVVASCAAALDLPEAVDRWRSAVEFRERVLGPTHPASARSRIELGLCLLARGQRDEAEDLLSDSVAVLATPLEPSHRTLVRARAALSGPPEASTGD